MIVIHVINTLNQGGGVNSFVYDLSKRMVENNHEVHLIAINRSRFGSESIVQELINFGIFTYNLNSKGKFGFIFNIFKLRRNIKRIKSRTKEKIIINTHLKVSEIAVFLATTFIKNISLFTTYHSFYYNYKMQVFLIKNRFCHFIAVSQESKDELVVKYKVSKNKVTTIYNGIDTESIYNIHYKCIEKNDVPTFLSVGRFTSQKQFDYSITAFNDINSNYLYKIIGDGPDKEKLTNLSQNNSKIEFVGKVERYNVFNIINESDIIIMPSKHEGYSIFLLEVIALNKPLILTDINSFREVFNEKPLGANEAFRVCKWGCLVQTESNAIKNAIEWMIEHREKLNSMSKYLSEISSNYDIRKTTEKYLQLYTRFNNDN